MVSVEIDEGNGWNENKHWAWVTMEEIQIVGCDCLSSSWHDSSVGNSIWKNFSGCVFQIHSGQVSIWASKTRSSVVNIMYIRLPLFFHIQKKYHIGSSYLKKYIDMSREKYKLQTINWNEKTHKHRKPKDEMHYWKSGVIEKLLMYIISVEKCTCSTNWWC